MQTSRSSPRESSLSHLSLPPGYLTWMKGEQGLRPLIVSGQAGIEGDSWPSTTIILLSPPLPLPLSSKLCAHFTLNILTSSSFTSLPSSSCPSSFPFVNRTWECLLPVFFPAASLILFPCLMWLWFALLDECLQKDLTWPLLEMVWRMSEGVRVKWSAGASKSLHHSHCSF